MTDAEVKSLRSLRIAVASESAALAAQLSALGSSCSMSNDLKLARTEMDAANCLLGIIDLRLSLYRKDSVSESVAACEAQAMRDEAEPEAPQPPRAVKRRATRRFTMSMARPALAMELETGTVIEVPSATEAAKLSGASYSLVSKVISATSADDWRRGPKYLASATMRHSKGWAFIYKEKLEGGENDK